jgi:hypothetical protein
MPWDWRDHTDIIKWLAFAGGMKSAATAGTGSARGRPSGADVTAANLTRPPTCTDDDAPLHYRSTR